MKRVAVAWALGAYNLVGGKKSLRKVNGRKTKIITNEENQRLCERVISRD